MTDATATARYYWAITGRIAYDEEDTAFITPEPCTEKEAIDAFRQLMIDMAINEEEESEEDLRSRMDLSPNQELAEGVYVINTFYSSAPIM